MPKTCPAPALADGSPYADCRSAGPYPTGVAFDAAVSVRTWAWQAASPGAGAAHERADGCGAGACDGAVKPAPGEATDAPAATVMTVARAAARPGVHMRCS